jgi:hypothetical protein
MSGRKKTNSSSSSSASVVQVVDDEEETVQQSEMILTDITAMKTNSQESGQNTAIKKFNEMILKVGDQIFGDDEQLSFEHIPATKWNKDGKKMMGLFADYMRREGLSLSANLGYCSAIKTHLLVVSVLLLVVSVLIDTNDVYAVADRCVLVMQWYLLGRISEMYNLSLRQLHLG